LELKIEYSYWVAAAEPWSWDTTNSLDRADGRQVDICWMYYKRPDGTWYTSWSNETEFLESWEIHDNESQFQSDSVAKADQVSVDGMNLTLRIDHN